MLWENRADLCRALERLPRGLDDWTVKEAKPSWERHILVMKMSRALICGPISLQQLLLFPQTLLQCHGKSGWGLVIGHVYFCCRSSEASEIN